ncbi:MAG: hypothetical protein D3904_00405 [Candidatus Electrothrix sp. EH2]|nr:hypothetical protein [Candidatus Electrothrix sp. EH2]
MAIKQYIVIGTCTFLFIIFCAASISAQTGQELILRGDTSYRQFDNINALSYYKKALEVQPDNFDCLIKVNRAYNDIGEDVSPEKSEPYYEPAVQQAEKLQRMFPEKAESYYWLAVSYGNLALLRGSKEKVKLSEKVERNIQKAITLHPNYADAYVVLGIFYKEVAGLNSFLKAFARLFFGKLPDGTYEDAARSFKKAIRLRTSRPIYTYFHLGRTYEHLNKPEQAKSIYFKALKFPETDHRDHIVIKQIKERLQSR